MTEEYNQCKSDRVYAQKYMGMEKSPEFQHVVMSVIQDNNNISIDDLRTKIREKYDVDLFQHDVDIGISTIFVVEDLLEKETIHITYDDKVITKNTDISDIAEYRLIFGEVGGIITIS